MNPPTAIPECLPWIWFGCSHLCLLLCFIASIPHRPRP